MIFSKANLGTFSTSLAIQACGAATGVMTARLLGPAARGELATVILWPVILSNLGLMGCNCVLTRAVASEPQRECDWAATGLSVGIGSAVVYLVAGYFLLPLLLPSDRDSLLPIARFCLLLLPLDIFNQVLLAIDHGRMRWRRYNLLRLSFVLFYLALIAGIGVTHKAQIRWFVAAFLASHLLTVLVRLWVQRRSLAAGRIRLSDGRNLLRAGVPYFGATASNLFSLQFDTILVVGLLNTEAAGIYAVASAFANGPASLSEALGITSFAILSNEKNAASQEKIITEMFRQSALISCGVGIGLSWLIRLLVVPLFGIAFTRAIHPAVVLVLAASLMVPANILNQGLRGVGRPQAGLVSQLSGSAVIGLAGLLLLRRFGLMGMSSAVLLGAFSQLLVLIAAAGRWLKISPFAFWPFGARNVRLFYQQIAALRLRVSRSPA
jgi:O-antigen/teichoic acid export membrane protein